MLGKWDAVLKKLRRAPRDTDRDESIKEEVQRLTDGGLAEVGSVPHMAFSLPLEAAVSDSAQAYVRLRAHKDRLEEALSKTSFLLDAIGRMVETGYEAQGITSVKLESGRSVSSQPEPVGVIENPIMFRDWCVKNGYKDQLTLPWSTMNAIVKERLEEGQEEPPGVKAYFRPKLVLR